jgi:ketosteroid isomerase-like protein
MQENVEIVRRVYEAINRGLTASGAEAAGLFLEVFDPAVVLEQWTALPGTGGVFHGYEGLLSGWRELTESLEDIRFVLEHHVETGDTVVFAVHARARGRESQVDVSLRLGHLWKLKDRRVVRWAAYSTVDEALAAAGLRE